MRFDAWALAALFCAALGVSRCNEAPSVQQGAALNCDAWRAGIELPPLQAALCRREVQAGL